MRWQKGRRSDNVVFDSGSSGGGSRFGGGRGLGLGGIVILAILGLVFFKDPTALLSQVDTGGGTAAPATTPADPNDPQVDFVRAILGDTEDEWAQIFARQGRQYEQPQLTLFSGRVNTACGAATAAVGPFYCPGDRHVYLDLAFFQELQDRFHTTGDFARAYVIAHEVGHHVQNLLGVFDQVDAARRRGATLQGANGLSVKQELQADCLAGVWAHAAEQRNQWLDPGDLEAALNAASQIGDDTLQRESRGDVMPDSFTHGTSAQRVHWFKAGFDSGDIGQCNTFAGPL